MDACCDHNKEQQKHKIIFLLKHEPEFLVLFFILKINFIFLNNYTERGKTLPMIFIGSVKVLHINTDRQNLMD